MKLTKSQLKKIIKEELALMGALEVEQNFAAKYNLLEIEEASDEPEHALERRAKIGQFVSDLAADCGRDTEELIRNLEELFHDSSIWGEMKLPDSPNWDETKL